MRCGHLLLGPHLCATLYKQRQRSLRIKSGDCLFTELFQSVLFFLKRRSFGQFERLFQVSVAERFLSVGRLDGSPSVAFFRVGSNVPAAASENDLHVLVGASSHPCFDSELYFNTLRSFRFGRIVLFAPLLTSTMDVMNTYVSDLVRLRNKSSVLGTSV